MEITEGLAPPKLLATIPNHVNELAPSTVFNVISASVLLPEATTLIPVNTFVTELASILLDVTAIVSAPGNPDASIPL